MWSLPARKGVEASRPAYRGRGARVQARSCEAQKCVRLLRSRGASIGSLRVAPWAESTAGLHSAVELVTWRVLQSKCRRGVHPRHHTAHTSPPHPIAPALPRIEGHVQVIPATPAQPNSCTSKCTNGTRPSTQAPMLQQRHMDAPKFLPATGAPTSRTGLQRPRTPPLSHPHA